jgi:site-specific DNA-cytosine methylase
MNTFTKVHRAASTTDYESWKEGGVSPTLNVMDNTAETYATVLTTQHDGTEWIVRRLTPLECERLQGFPDHWTDVPSDKGKPASDSQRFKQIGNAVTVDVAHWLGLLLIDADSRLP